MHLLSKNDSKSIQYWAKELREFQLDSMFDTNVLARAYLYTNSISDLKTEKKHVTASIGENNKYWVEILSKNNLVYGNCSCPYDGKCKHLAALLLVFING